MLTVHLQSERLSASSILQDIMDERGLTETTLLAQVEAAVHEYTHNSEVRETIYDDIVANINPRYGSDKYRVMHTNRGFDTVQLKTLVSALDESRKQHDETVYKLIVWLCWIEHFGDGAGERVRRSYKADAIRLVQAVDLAHKTKGAAFPLNLFTLNNLIRSLVADARDLRRPSLHILEDTGDRGSFFYPSLHMAITNGMIDLANRGCDVRLAVYGRVHAVAWASSFSALEPRIRLGHPEFQGYLERYLTHLRHRDNPRTDKAKSAPHRLFRDWLADHRERYLDDLHDWVVRYAPAEYQDIGKALLGRWVTRAHSVVFDDGSFTDNGNDANALLALQWCRERYFEELLTYNNVAVRRNPSNPPSMILWLSEKQGAFGVVKTREQDAEQRGWIFSTDVVLSNQDADPADPRHKMLEAFESQFLSHWDDADDVPAPSWFDGVRQNRFT
jgi:hypothetical protein